MDELKPGSVIEGRGGKKYVYKGGDRKSKESYTEFQPTEKSSPTETGFGSKALETLGAVNAVAGDALSLNPAAYAAKKSTEAVQTLGNLLEQGAYSVGGKVTDVTGSPGLGYTANVATQAVPSILSGSAVKHVAGSILKPAGRFMMRSALKPSNVTAKQAEQAVETLLKEGVNVTPGGAIKLGEKVSGLSDEVNDLVAAAEKSGVTVNKFSVAKRAKDAAKDFTKQVDPDADVQAINKVTGRFLTHPEIGMKAEIPVQLAHDLKKGTYSILGSKAYGEVGSAAGEAQKALARGLKEEIEKAVPAVAGPNAKQKELLNALEQVAKRAEVAGNKNPIGLGALAENPAAAAAFALDRSELIKSILGRFLYSGAPSVLGNAARLGTAGLMATTANQE